MTKLWRPSRRLFLAGGASLIAAPAIVRAQSPIRAFPPGAFQSRGAIDAASGGGVTPVSVNATGALHIASPGTSATYSSITVASGTNTALILVLAIDTGSPAPTGFSAVWDSGGTNQSMTQLSVSQNASGVNGQAIVFGLRNPAVGNLSLAISWANSASGVYMDAIAFNNVSQTSDATAFPVAGRVNNSGSTTTSTITVPSSTNDYCVAVNVLQGGVHRVSVSDTELFYSNAGANDNGCAQYGVGASSKTLTTTLDNSAGWNVAAIDIAAA